MSEDKKISYDINKRINLYVLQLIGVQGKKNNHVLEKPLRSQFWESKKNYGGVCQGDNSRAGGKWSDFWMYFEILSPSF